MPPKLQISPARIKTPRKTRLNPDILVQVINEGNHY